MSSAEICAKPPNTTLSPYTMVESTTHSDAKAKRPGESESDSQYWRYDVSKKRQKHGEGDGEKLCFKFTSSGTCPRGEKCYFRQDEDARQQSITGVCFDFLNKGKCERGPDCNFKHGLQEENDGACSRGSLTGTSSSNRSIECWFCLSSPNVESHLISSIGEHYYYALAKGPILDDHVLIILVEHLPNTLCIQEECETELNRVQNSLKAYFGNQGKAVVFFEWIFKRGTHANLQVVPVPVSGHLASEISSIWLLKSWGSSLRQLKVLAGLLNMADRADWKNCKLTKEEETKTAERFKKQCEAYDPHR